MKKKNQDVPMGAPGWMVTFADMMTLLLCFFVLLLSFSSIQESKFNKAMGSLQAYLGLLSSKNISIFESPLQTPQHNTTSHKNLAKKKEDEKATSVAILSLAKDVKKQASDKQGMGGSIEILEIFNALRIRIPSSIAFDTGEYGLSKKAKGFFQKIALLVKDLPYTISVEGYTDTVPIFSDKYESNWELSSARALKVVHYFLELGIPADRLSAAAFGSNRPIGPNDTVEGRQRNRRIELVITLDPEQIDKYK